MAKNTQQDGGVTLPEEELVVLRGIVHDWLGEEIVLPPYIKELAALLQKLGVDGAGAARKAGRKRRDAGEDAPRPADADTVLDEGQLRRNLG